MLSSTTTRTARRPQLRGLLLVLAAAVAGIAAASPATAQAAGDSSLAVQKPTYRGQVGFDELAARAVVPARLDSLPTAALAARTLDASGWPIQAVDTTRGVMITQWISFSVSGLKTSPTCWIDVRVGVRPIKGDSANVELLAQLVLQGRFNPDPPMRLARLAVDALRRDLFARAESGRDAGRLSALLDLSRATPVEFPFCGVKRQ